MSQSLVIRFIPVEIFLLSVVAGWAAVSGIPLLIQSAPASAASAEVGAVSALPETVASVLSPVFTPEVRRWTDEIVAWAELHQLDPNLVATVMQIESCGAPHVVSGSGAQGLFQVMPFHFAEGEDMQDPDTNAGKGVAYLELGLARAGGNAGLALAGYNGGHSMIGRDGSLWPAETKRYWYWGTGIYGDALNGLGQSSRLQEWLEAGGASLCARAAEQLGMAP